MEWKIGNVKIKNQIVLAPMAGYSNTSFRKIIKEMGAGLIYAEMVSDKALTYHNEKTLQLLKMSEEERLAGGVQQGTIRISVGLENVEDLIDDLNQAFEQID